MKIIQEKNSIFQSCRFCSEGGSTHKITNEKGEVYYACIKHKNNNQVDNTSLTLLMPIEKEGEISL